MSTVTIPRRPQTKLKNKPVAAKTVVTVPLELDRVLAPFEIWEVPLENGNTLKFHNPLILQPFWLEDDPDFPDDPPCERFQNLGADCDELFISAFGKNREMLLSCIYCDIRFVWQHIVSKNDGSLGVKNKIIKKNYLNIAEEIFNG